MRFRCDYLKGSDTVCESYVIIDTLTGIVVSRVLVSDFVNAVGLTTDPVHHRQRVLDAELRAATYALLMRQGLENMVKDQHMSELKRSV